MGLVLAYPAMAGVSLQSFGVDPSVPEPDPVLGAASFAPVTSDLPPHDAGVGTMAGQAGTDGGTATYQVPIVVPPGRAGMQPSLSLNYNSRSGDGIAGMGWTISGLSSIHRCPQTPEQEDPALSTYTPAVTYTGSDRLCLDGQRLVAVSGAYGATGTEYRTEVDTYARIRQTGGGLTGAATCFRVEQKDGRIVHYGAVTNGTTTPTGCAFSTANARTQPTGAAATLSWQVERIEDRVGNNQTYSYTNPVNGEVLLSKVAYTGFSPTSTVGDRAVTFNYVPRTTAASTASDVASSYLAGGLTMQTQVLASITTAIGGINVRSYTPSYAAAAYNGRLMMTDLQECATNANGAACHPATHFEFNDGPLLFLLKSLVGLGLPADVGDAEPGRLRAHTKIAIIGDLDGDGTREGAASVPITHGEPDHVFLLQLTGDRQLQSKVDLTGTDFGISPAAYVDIDSDGRAELMKWTAGTGSQSLSFGVWKLARGSVVSSGATPQQSFDALFQTVGSNISMSLADLPHGQGSRPYVNSADVDGDGRKDIVIVKATSTGCGPSDAIGNQDGVFVYHNTTTGLLGSPTQTTATFDVPAAPLFCLARTVMTTGSLATYHEENIEHIGDFDGNGLPDFYLTYWGNDSSSKDGAFAGVRKTTRSGSTLVSTLTSPLQCDGTPSDECNWKTNGYATHWIDVNGDGLEDFVIARPSTLSQWHVRLNQGGVFGPDINTGSSDGLKADSTASGYRFRYANGLGVMDVDSDGKADILIPSKAQGFALKMCAIQTVPLISDLNGTRCPDAGGPGNPVSPSSIDSPMQCAAWACPPDPIDPQDPDTGSVNLPHNSEEMRLKGYPFQWGSATAPTLPAFSSYNQGDAHNGAGNDSSVYHLSMLKFVQTSASTITAVRVETPLVSALRGQDYFAAGEDLFGDGLPDLVNTIGCSNQQYTYTYSATTVTTNACAAVNDVTHGPAYLPDGPNNTDGQSASYFETHAVLYGSINQGLAGTGGSPSTFAFSQGKGPPPPTVRQTTPAAPLLQDPVYLPGLLNAVSNGVGDQASWGYLPLSVPSVQSGLDLYKVPTANGYEDSRHYYFESSMPVVYGMLQNSGTGATSATRSAIYGYDSAMYNHWGRGFQGFRVITAEDGNLIRTTTTYHQKFPLTGRVASVSTGATDLVGLVIKPVQAETDAWRCTRSDRTAYCPGDHLAALPVPTGTTVYQPFLDKQSIQNFDLKTGTATSHTDTVNAASATATTSGWDDATCGIGSGVYGNLNHQLVTHYDDASGGKFVSSHETATANCYDVSGSANWWVDQLKSSSATRRITYASGHLLPAGASAPDQALATSYTWNADRTPLTKIVQDNVLNQKSTTTWTYPATSYGLPSKVEVNAPDLDAAHSPTRTTSYTYTTDGAAPASDGYFVLTTKNGLNQTTKTEVATNDGQVTRSTDPNGVQQVATYDAFGRAIQVDHRDNSAGHTAFEAPVQTAYTSCLDSFGAVGHCVSSQVGEDAYEANAAYRITTVQDGYPTRVTWVDQLGRSIKQAERGFSGTFIASLTDYTISGTVYQQSTPYFVGVGSAYFTIWSYDALNRPTKKVSDLDLTSTDLVTDYAYSGRTTKITAHDSNLAPNADGTCPTAVATNLCAYMTRSTNVLGQLMQTTESPAGVLQTTDYWTEPLGHVAAIRDPELYVTTASYNPLGQRTGSTDPDQGTWAFTYDAFGELLSQTDARGVITTINTRDVLGRTTEQQAVPPVSLPAGMANETVVDRWVFDTGNGIGDLGQQKRLRGPNRTIPGSNPEVWREDYTYEPLTARASTTTTTISEGATQTLTSDVHYDTYGRPDTHTYPSPTGANRLVVRTAYTPYGQPSALKNDTTNATYWTATAANEWGHVTTEIFAGGLTGTHQDYHSTAQSYQLNWSGGGLSDRFVYGYDSFGNLKSQSRNAIGATNSETYTYDPLQRLTKAVRDTGAAVTYDYTKSGNLKYKSDYSTTVATAYTYGAAGSHCGPHAVTGVSRALGGTATYTCDANGNVIGGSTITSTFDADNHPRVLTRVQPIPGAQPCNRTDTVFCDAFEVVPPGTTTGSTTWTYAATGERSSELSSQGTRYFGPGGYEMLNGVSKHELGPVVVSRTGNTDTVSIVLKDRLGSTLDTIDGTTIDRRSYDAFGAVRNGDMSDRTNGTLNLADTIHGFTDHTHADDVALIHMGGRVYDYTLGRFLSVDPIIGNPANSQSLNPYSYLGNNPLSGTDPTGYACQEDSNGQVTSTCLKSNDGINEITNAAGKSVGTVIVASKGDQISVNFHNGGSLNSTFTGKTGDISRVLNGPPSDIGAIGKLTNSTLEGSAASYAMAPDKTFSSVDYMAQRAQAQGIADAYATRQWNFAHEGMRAGSLLIDAPIGDLADFLNTGQREGFASKAAAIGLLGVAIDAATLGRGGAVVNDFESVAIGAVGDLRSAGLKDAHHVIQDAAVRDLAGYDTNLAMGVQLRGPSTAAGSPHYLATQVQRRAGGGTYGAERRIGYRALRRAGVSKSDARRAVRESDAYFDSIGVTRTTPTRVPGNRDR